MAASEQAFDGLHSVSLLLLFFFLLVRLLSLLVFFLGRRGFDIGSNSSAPSDMPNNFLAEQLYQR
jgi:hypothetical protein